MKSHITFLAILLFALVFSACDQPVENASENLETAPPDRHCGYSQLYEVRTESGRAIGAFELKNDEKDLWVIYFPSPGFQPNNISLFWGRDKSVPRDAAGKPEFGKFPVQDDNPDKGDSWFIKLTGETDGVCGMMYAAVSATKDDGAYTGWVTNGNLGNSLKGIEYCRQSCSSLAIVCTLDDSLQQPKTVTQKQWKLPEGENAQAETLEKFFDQIFENGLTLGCEKKCTFNSAKAIIDYFPATGPAETLPSDLTDPSTSSANNSLLGELLALKLSIEFDLQLQTFAPSPTQLANLEIAEGAFRGWSVAELATEAEAILGGCASNYSPLQITQVIINVNKAFAKKAQKSQFLVCPTKKN